MRNGRKKAQETQKKDDSERGTGYDPGMVRGVGSSIAGIIKSRVIEGSLSLFLARLSLEIVAFEHHVQFASNE